MQKYLIALCFAVAAATPSSPSSALAHDAPLDLFGCHHDQNRRHYHCHEGAYKRLSFDSKPQMIERLRNQYIALGRTWPFDDTIIDVDHPMAITETTLEPQPISSQQLMQTSHGDASRPSHLGQRTIHKQTPPKTKRQPISEANVKAETNNVEKPSTTSSALRRKRTEPELKVWIAQIRTDGRPIFANTEGERFYLDDSGNKVLVARRES